MRISVHNMIYETVITIEPRIKPMTKRRHSKISQARLVCTYIYIYVIRVRILKQMLLDSESSEEFSGFTVMYIYVFIYFSDFFFC